MSRRIERLAQVLACPRCRGAITLEATRATCPCGAEAPIRDGRIYFTTPPATTDALDGAKGRLKRRLGRLYYTLGVRFLAPTYPFDFEREVRGLEPSRRLVVDLGCGANRVDPDTIGVDQVDYEAVDVVCDLARLPFRDASVDAFVSRSVLEHLPDSEATCAAVARATRPGGAGMHLVPFLFPFHASPDDFRRWTHRGLARLFPGMEATHQRAATGPVTLGLLLGIETLATILALGFEGPKSYLYLALCALLFPLKYLDAFFVGRPSFIGLAPTIFTVFRKPGGE